MTSLEPLHRRSRPNSGIATEISDAVLELSNMGSRIKEIIINNSTSQPSNRRLNIWGVNPRTILDWDCKTPQPMALLRIIKSRPFRKLSNCDKKLIWCAFFARVADGVAVSNPAISLEFAASLLKLSSLAPNENYENLHCFLSQEVDCESL